MRLVEIFCNSLHLSMQELDLSVDLNAASAAESEAAWAIATSSNSFYSFIDGSVQLNYFLLFQFHLTLLKQSTVSRIYI